jgi:hypothetical protein
VPGGRRRLDAAYVNALGEEGERQDAYKTGSDTYTT